MDMGSSLHWLWPRNGGAAQAQWDKIWHVQLLLDARLFHSSNMPCYFLTHELPTRSDYLYWSKLLAKAVDC